MKKLKKIILLISIPAILISALGFTDNYFEISKNLEIFTSLYRELNIFYVDETKPGDLMKTGIDAMLKSLDPYTVYYPESKIEDYRFMTTGQYGGIGALINSIDNNVVIAEPYEGFPAEKAGLRAGDIITHVDGEPVTGKDQSDISDALKGQAGTEVEITMIRGEDPPKKIKLTRGEVQIPDVPYSGMVDDKTGYIKLTSFTKTASKNVKSAFRKLTTQDGAEQIILDLRDNGGGLLREAVSIVNMFVPKGTEIVSTKGKLEEWNKTHVALLEPQDADIPVIVLVNGSSASASEIVSGTLQDLDRAVILGTNTYGKGLVQQTKDVTYNAKLKLTVAKYYTPSGRCILRIDYSHRSDEGQAEVVPDSLVNAFKTANGRPVFDGRGIDPDVEVELEDLSNILHGLVLDNVVFNYATQYQRKNEAIESAATFKIDDADFDTFKSYALSQPFDYNTQTEAEFDRLKKVAEMEKYFHGAEAEFDALFDKISPDKSEDLEKFQDQIKDVLANEIVSRYFYQTGRIEYSLQNDQMIDKAIEVFNTNYQDILAGTGE